MLIKKYIPKTGLSQVIIPQLSHKKRWTAVPRGQSYGQIFGLPASLHYAVTSFFKKVNLATA